MQGAIHACFDRIHHHIADDQIHADIRVRRLELVQQRSEVSQHQTGQCVYPQCACGFGLHVAHLVDHAVGLGYQFGAIAQKGLPEFTQAHQPRAAVKQSRAQIVFELLHPRGHH